MEAFGKKGVNILDLSEYRPNEAFIFIVCSTKMKTSL
jgi:hypothetical protein